MNRCSAVFVLTIAASAAPPQVAPTPPMGWNSCGVYGDSVREDEVRANADYVATHLHSHGYEYVVIDMAWYIGGGNCGQTAKLHLDEWGRYVPSACEFPSAGEGRGFKPLADYIHSKGLKFGFHIMRGISRQAVEQNTPILNSRFKAGDVADKSSVCPWYSPRNPRTYGIDATKPGAQDWYDSIIRQYAEWGVDFLKVDDISYPYHAAEIEMIHRAIEHSGRPIALSLSPGPAPVTSAEHVKQNANMWRISVDLFDDWKNPREFIGLSPTTGKPTADVVDIWQGQMEPSWGSLYYHFDLFDRWSAHAGPGHWPDGDFLVFGRLGTRNSQYGGKDHWTRLTHDEQRTLMTLWAMARSPLFFTGELRDNDDWTLNLITNDEVLDITKRSRNNHQLFRKGDSIAWTAECPDGACKYLALFNASDESAKVDARLPQLGCSKGCTVRDLWQHADVAPSVVGDFIPAHGSRLFRLELHKRTN